MEMFGKELHPSTEAAPAPRRIAAADARLCGPVGRWTVDALGAPHTGERSEKELISSFVDRKVARKIVPPRLRIP